MKTIEDVQRFKEDKCSLLLQTADCCDINEMLEQLKNHKSKNKDIIPKISIERNNLLKKYHQNYVSYSRQKSNFSSTQISSIDNNMYQKSVGSGFKLYPKFVQNIDSMGFEKPNWKPLMFNDKSESQFSSLSITNSAHSFQSKGKISRSNTRMSNRLDSLLNSDSHKQKSVEMSLRKEKTNEQFSSSDSLVADDDSPDIEEIPENKYKLYRKKLLLGSTNLQLKTSQYLPRQFSSYDMTVNDNFNQNDTSNNHKINFPPLKCNIDQVIEEGVPNIFTQNKSQSTPRITLIEREKTREANLVNLISISKMSLSTTKGDEDITSIKLSGDEQKQNISQFFNHIIRQKTDLDSYITLTNKNNEKTHYAPPNTPRTLDTSSRENTPSTSFDENAPILLTINDPKAFPPSKPFINQNRNIHPKESVIQDSPIKLIVTNKRPTPAQPVIKSRYSNNNKVNNKIEKNLQKKIGENSVNMIKINSKNVRFNNINPNSSNNLNSNHTESLNGFDKPKNSIVHSMHQSNEKLFVNIYIPNLI
jgi:hypothetical protein